MTNFITAPQVSIVVPMFNTEKYLDRCIQSLVNQKELEIEIILVNDGSIDSSGTLCEAWGKRDSRIRIIHKENEGVTVARKIGVEHSIGEWICFVDSDDELPEQSVYTLFKHIDKDVDIIIGTIEYDGPSKWPYKLHYEKKNNLQYIKSILNRKVHPGPVARLIRKNLFDHFVFDIPSEFTHGEDFIMNIRLGQKALSVIFLPDIVYRYIFRPDSVTTNIHPLYISKNYRNLRKQLLEKSINQDYRKKLRMTLILYHIRWQWWLLKFFIRKILRRTSIT